tara:strand:+ start:58 stop:1131 length:1074 start_codon:yes stop_codon:yes gene_type:complete
MPQSADKKPERYIGPDGKSKIRMVPVDREIVKKEAAPKVDPVKFAAHLAKNERPKKMTSTQKTLADIRKRADKRANEKYTAPTKAEVDADKKKDRNAQRAAGIKRPSMTPGSLQRKQYSGMMGKLKRESAEEVQNESAPTAKQVKMGIGIARDKRYAGGNMTGASKAMNKVKKGLDRHPAVSKELRKQNESVNEISRSMTPMNKKFGARVVDPKKFDMYKKHVKKHNVDEPSVRFIHDNPNHPESKRTMKNNKHIAQAAKLYKDAHKESVTELSMGMKDVSKTGLNKKATGSVDKDKLKKDLEKLKKNLGEKLKVSDGMGSWIKDFQGSDAPQFKGKDKEERRDMAIAAYLSAKKGD